MKKQKKEKVKKENKPLSKWLIILLSILVCVAVFGGIIVGAYFIIKAISYQWFIFGIIFVLMPFGVANLKRIAFKKGNYTEEQNKQANIKVFIYTLFYWLCDLFYMAFIIDSLTWKFIFGGLIMVIIFYNLSNAFVNGNHTFKLGLLQDFLVGIGLSVYLIYIIPNKNLQNVIIPIIAGVYGGLLTLVGVAWTIKENEEKHKKDKSKNKVFLYMLKIAIECCENQDILLQNEEIFEKYILPKVDGNKASRDDFITNRICNNPFMYDKEITQMALDGAISNDEFEKYTEFKKDYQHYIDMRITFFDNEQMYIKSKNQYLNSLEQIKTLLGETK